MLQLLIQSYQTEIKRVFQYGDSDKETFLRTAFQTLLTGYCESKHFLLIPDLEYRTQYKTTVYPEGTVKDALRLRWGYWIHFEPEDDLDQDIQKKLAKGYPNDNILVENSQMAVLIQQGSEIQRVKMAEVKQLDALLTAFIHYERPAVRDFRQAIKRFKADLPTILNTLREMLDTEAAINNKFQTTFEALFTLCQQSINPKINAFEIREMIIQHILTADIFLTVFNEVPFHRKNAVAQQLEAVVNTFFTGKTQSNTLKSLESYYAAIRREAANIANHFEKQKFLKVIYENFYKIYNPKAADRLGIVYTPNEIVRFMIESTDYLLDKHFNRLLADEQVEILDPATGTGTFITELIEYLPKNRLRFKYQNEIYCNEVAILPYYIANLNIEYTYQQKMGEYEVFSHLYFVDTLENFSEPSCQTEQKSLVPCQCSLVGLLESKAAKAEALDSNGQNQISVIIGNPPYNANQQNGNDNNKNREYPEIDKAIKRTYIAHSTAQKTKLYDMYARFLRWASHRIGKKGVVAFVSNNSFLEARTYDGFRKVVSEEFNAIYIIDLKGNARMTGEKRCQEGGNVFSDAIRVGIAIYFLVKDEPVQGCNIGYHAVQDYATADDKKAYLTANKLKNLHFKRVIPDKNHNWLNLTDNDFDTLLLLATPTTKPAKSQINEQTVFHSSVYGVVTARDEWVYDKNDEQLKAKIQFFIERFNLTVEKLSDNQISQDELDHSIKLSDSLKKKLFKLRKLDYHDKYIVPLSYRPFTNKLYYSEKVLSDRLTAYHYEIFGDSLKNNKENQVICVTAYRQVPFVVQITNKIFDYSFGSRNTRGLSLYRYDCHGNRIENITDWGLNQFRLHYQDKSITKENIFHYTYAVLHHPVYRKKYAFNLEREFPRLPFYDDFQQWAVWGKQLIKLHLSYETVKKYPLQRVEKKRANNQPNPAKLKADKDAGKILLDAITTLHGVPPDAWAYKLGNLSALEWILDQYKEKKPRDETIAEKFNSYRFADYKESVIELLQRVCTVSVETIKIINKLQS